jgi:Domain of unknown function DUF29
MAAKTGKQHDLYTSDFYRWTMETASALRHNKVKSVDFQIVAGELEDLGRTEQRELRNRLKQLMLHILKWQYQPARRSLSWRASVNAQRREIQRLLKDNPSLKRQVKAQMTEAYSVARDLAVSQTRLPYDRFPVACPFTLEDLMSKELDLL